MRDKLSQTFVALADPTRRAMLARLSSGEASVSDLAKPFLKSMSLPAVTKHLKVLEQAGLVTKTRDAQWRPCRLNAAGLKPVADWMDEYRQFWEASFDRLDAYLKTVAGKQQSPAEPINPSVSRTPSRKAKSSQPAADAAAAAATTKPRRTAKQTATGKRTKGKPHGR